MGLGERDSNEREGAWETFGEVREGEWNVLLSGDIAVEFTRWIALSVERDRGRVGSVDGSRGRVVVWL